MTAEQQLALERLGRLTESGRIGQDYSEQCSYQVGGTDNAVQLFQMGATDVDMKNFSLLPQWHTITLRECPISDVGLKHLANQSELRFLDIGETHITTLQPVKQAAQMRQLWCDRLDGLTDKRATVLAHFQKLEFLDLCYTSTGDATAELLGDLKELRKLNLLRTSLTDNGLSFIANLPKLETLGLRGTSVTDHGLRHLYAMDQLRLLVIGDTKITATGKAGLRQAMPNLKFVESGGY